MISSLVALLIVFAAVIGSAATIGMLAYLLHRIRRIEGTSSGGAGSRQLLDDVHRIREELLAVQDEVSALSERLEFTEKLLMSGDDAAGSAAPE